MDELTATPIPDWPTLTEQTERLLAVFKGLHDEAKRAAEQVKSYGDFLRSGTTAASSALTPFVAAVRQAAQALAAITAGQAGQKTAPAASGAGLPAMLPPRAVVAGAVQTPVQGMQSPAVAAQQQGRAMGREMNRTADSPMRQLNDSALKAAAGLLAVGLVAKRWGEAASPLAADTLSKSFQLLAVQAGSVLGPALANISGWLQQASDGLKAMDPETKKFVGTVAAAGAALVTMAAGIKAIQWVGSAFGIGGKAAAAAAVAAPAAKAAPWAGIVGPAGAASTATTATWGGRAMAGLRFAGSVASRLALPLYAAYEAGSILTGNGSPTLNALGWVGNKIGGLFGSSGKAAGGAAPAGADEALKNARKQLDALGWQFDLTERAKGLKSLAGQAVEGVKAGGPQAPEWRKLAEEISKAAGKGLRLGADPQAMTGIFGIEEYRKQMQSRLASKGELDMEIRREQVENNKALRQVSADLKEVINIGKRLNVGAQR